MPIEHKPDGNNYFIDAESATEMARLINQDRLFTENMGGLFPERHDVSSMHDRLDNASFLVMEALEPLEFADDSFDMVNARSIFGFMPTTAWPGLIQECVRI